MKNVFAFCNQKGGVGKTTSVINIAAALSQARYRVLILDLDAQGNATSGLGEEKPSLESTTYQLIVENSDPAHVIKKTQFKNIDLIPANADLSAAELELISRERREFFLRAQLEKIRAQYDFIFIDCPPSLGLLTVNALTAADYLIIPLQCEYYALEGLSQLLTTHRMVQENLNPGLEVGGVVLTMADFRTNLTEQVIAEVRGFFKEKVFQSVIPRSVKISEAPSFGKPAIFYDPSNKGSKSYKAVAREFARWYAPQDSVLREQSEESIVTPDEKSIAETVSEGGL